MTGNLEVQETKHNGREVNSFDAQFTPQKRLKLSKKPSNILFITLDQYRGECLSCLDHAVVKTPNLDLLTSESTLFTRHYSNVTPCAPSRASIHTGLYLKNHRVCRNGTPLDARHTNWALEMRKHGYDPVLLGYTDTANDPRKFPPNDPILKHLDGPLPGITPLFDWKTMGDAKLFWADYLILKGYEFDQTFLDISDPINDPGDMNWSIGTIPNSGSQDGYIDSAFYRAEDSDSAFMVDKAMEYIGRNRSSKWILHLSLLRPHPPWVVPAPYNTMYHPNDVDSFNRKSTTEEEGKQHPWLKAFFDKGVCLNSGSKTSPSNEHDLRKLKSAYYGLISEVDAQVGRLVQFLKETGEFDKTLIIVTSDHGEQLGEHNLLGKLGYFDESYFVPLIIHDPRPESEYMKGRRIDLFTENVDIMPTMLDWLGIEVPHNVDGLSLLPLLHGEQPKYWRTEAFWEYDFRDVLDHSQEVNLGITMDQCNLVVLRNSKFKLVHFAVPSFPCLLFDIENDPDEMINLADDPRYQSVLMNLLQKLIRWQMTHNDQTLTHCFLTKNGVSKRSSQHPQAKFFPSSQLQGHIV